MKTFSLTALLALSTLTLALGVAANPVQLDNKLGNQLEKRCVAKGRGCSNATAACCPGNACQGGVSTNPSSYFPMC
jgi:hypothetical protein